MTSTTPAKIPANNAPVTSEIAQFLDNLNAAWLSRDYERLGGYYHPDIVLLPPDAGAPLLGKEAVLDTYREFHSVCSVERFSVTELSGWGFADTERMQTSTTIVHMRFAIDYRITPSPQSADSPEVALQSEEGMEIYTLQHTADESHPVIIWRAQFTL